MSIPHTEIQGWRQNLSDESHRGFWHRRRAAKHLAWLATRSKNQGAPASPSEAQAIVEGLVAGLESIHWGTHLICRRALERVKAPQMREVICDILLERDLPRLRTIAVHSRYEPQDPVRRAAYLFVTGQLHRYEEYDPAGELLEQFYVESAPLIRDRMLGLARSWGDERWQQLIIGILQKYDGAVMSEAELAAAIEVLQTEQRWEQLWTLVLTSPLSWSWRGVQALMAAGWKPREKRAIACWRELSTAAQTVGDPKTLRGGLGQQRTVLHGNLGWIYTLAMSPDGTCLASGGGDRTITLWDLPGGRQRKVLSGSQGGIRALAFSPDGSLLASSSYDETIRLWELPSGFQRAILRGPQGRVRALMIRPDGTILVASREGNTIHLCELPSGRQQAVLHGYQEIETLAISPDGSTLASGSVDGTIILWELPSGRQQAVLRGHQDSVRSLAISPDGAILVSGSRSTIIVWDLISRQQWMELRNFRHWIGTLAISPNGDTLAIGSWFGSVLYLWDLWGMHKMMRGPLGHLGQPELTRVQQLIPARSLSEEQRAVVRYATAVLRYRLEERSKATP